MSLIMVAIGLVMMIVGRQFYWIFVGGVAFVAGTYLVGLLGLSQTVLGEILYSFLFAVIGLLLTAVLKRWMARIAGVFASVLVVLSLQEIVGGETAFAWPAFIVMAALFLVLSFVWFGGTMVVISSLAGASIFVQNLDIPGLNPLILFITLSGVGIVAQFVLLQYGQNSPD